MITKIFSEEEYYFVLRRIEELIDLDPPNEAKELERLYKLCKVYEDEQCEF